MTDPLVPADTDLRDFQYMPLDVVRLVDSDLAALATGDEFRCAVILWCKAWHQVPASSLPNDDRLLSHLAGFGRDMKAWRAVRDMALRGFVECSDGRLYHPVIAQKAIEAADAKRRRRERTAKATAAREAKTGGRDVERNEPPDEERNVDRDDERNVHQGIGKGEGEGEGEGSEGIEDAALRARARDSSADLEARLREAAGWQAEPHPKLAVTGPIEALLANGADLDLDVLPVVKALGPKARNRTTWNYFVSAIAQARDDRVSASTLVSTPQDRRPDYVTRQPRKSTVDTILENLGSRDAEGDEPARQTG